MPSEDRVESRPRLKLVLLILGCVTGLLLGEALVRLLDAAPQVAFFKKEQFQLSQNIRIGWEPIPNEDSGGSTLDRRWNELQRNSLGFRDYEHSVEKVPGVYRILVIGDSVTKGFAVSNHNGPFPSVLERKLTELQVSNEVMNFGAEGYNTQQEVETLRDKGLRYSPDLVVLAYLLNDRDWPAHHLYMEMLQEEYGSGKVSNVRISPYLGWSALYRFLRFRIFESLPLVNRRPDERIQELFDLVQQDTVEEYFGVLADLQRSHGFQVLVMVFPYLDHLLEYEHGEHHEWARDLSSRHGFHHLDLLDVFLRCKELSDQEIAIDDVHPTFVGHYCAGWETAQFIKANIIDAPSSRR
jgi:hypothetical protein